MFLARIRLAIAALALTAWLGFLGYLALGHAKPVVVSRSQRLVAAYVVKADVKPDGKDGPSIVVLGSFGQQVLPDGPITIGNWNQCLAANAPKHAVPGKSIAAGTYLLLLDRSAEGQFRVVSAPGGAGHIPVIYPWSDDVERQVR